jgi:hypothetical protein
MSDHDRVRETEEVLVNGRVVGIGLNVLVRELVLVTLLVKEVEIVLVTDIVYVCEIVKVTLRVNVGDCDIVSDLL